MGVLAKIWVVCDFCAKSFHVHEEDEPCYGGLDRNEDQPVGLVDVDVYLPEKWILVPSKDDDLDDKVACDACAIALDSSKY